MLVNSGSDIELRKSSLDTYIFKQSSEYDWESHTHSESLERSSTGSIRGWRIACPVSKDTDSPIPGLGQRK